MSARIRYEVDTHTHTNTLNIYMYVFVALHLRLRFFLIAGSYEALSFCLAAPPNGRHYAVNIGGSQQQQQQESVRPQPRPHTAATAHRFIELAFVRSGAAATALKLTLVPFKVMRFINCKNSFN